jgi:hypoxanthine phosphoribosyltransferase
MMKSYDYAQRDGVDEITWTRFAELAEELAVSVAAQDVDIVVGIARAGLFPAAYVAAALRKELYPVRITRRINDRVVYERPVWKVDVTADVAGRRVIVIDEMADSGETLRLVAERVRERGAASVVTASLVAHSWAAPQPEIVALTSDALVLFPWDARVFIDGVWQVNPEFAKALALHKGKAGDSASEPAQTEA